MDIKSDNLIEVFISPFVSVDDIIFSSMCQTRSPDAGNPIS